MSAEGANGALDPGVFVGFILRMMTCASRDLFWYASAQSRSILKDLSVSTSSMRRLYSLTMSRMTPMNS